MSHNLCANILEAFCRPLQNRYFLHISVACILSPCPRGSISKVCNKTRTKYCVHTRDVDNGGCDAGSQCVEIDVPACSPGQCCSPVNITCPSTYV